MRVPRPGSPRLFNGLADKFPKRPNTVLIRPIREKRRGPSGKPQGGMRRAEFPAGNLRFATAVAAVSTPSAAALGQPVNVDARILSRRRSLAAGDDRRGDPCRSWKPRFQSRRSHNTRNCLLPSPKVPNTGCVIGEEPAGAHHYVRVEIRDAAHSTGCPVLRCRPTGTACRRAAPEVTSKPPRRCRRDRLRHHWRRPVKPANSSFRHSRTASCSELRQ